MTRLFSGAALLAALLLTAPAWAANCGPLAAAEAELSNFGAGKLTSLNHDQLMFARGLYVATPPVSAYPEGEEAMFAKFDDGAGAVVFVSGDRACGNIGLSPSVTAILIDLGKTI